ncbi:hypothetical protein PHAVU_004G099600 [Phaseolus vulgaris]|uniref:Disease resistance R13L4/SHOC-2-like LRR domain-containing protein n=1 Tax=Phaseolus vulgaris TaxID=3885 RepID=V7C450_PHAVU|nr:hypothetical protein PHAVU_004G099600g [Phaseolus vulgaris]ESW24065.1 hypothetical protein PHAVU_004G099600g [Phaseolus vulgaris]
MLSCYLYALLLLFLFFHLASSIHPFNNTSQIKYIIEKERHALLHFKHGVAFHNSWVGSLTNLRYLNLSFYGFGGSIPTQLGSLTHLRYLDLSFNKLDGKLPYQLTNLSLLRYLDLGRNSFSRALPFQVGNLPLLHTLRLAGNFGVKPKDAEWLSNLSYLTNLSLYYLHNLDWLQLFFQT